MKVKIIFYLSIFGLTLLSTCSETPQKKNKIEKKEVVTAQAAPKKTPKKNEKTVKRPNYNDAVIKSTGITAEQLKGVQKIIKDININIDALKKGGKWEGENNKLTRQKYNQQKGKAIRSYLGDTLYFRKSKFDKAWSVSK